MDNKNVVKRLLDSMFDNNELISATVNVKSGLSIFNIRFDNAILDPNLEPATYVKKSIYHVSRDKERSDSYRKSKRDRKQTQFFDASEFPRSNDIENSTVSAPGLSPIFVQEEPSGDRHTSSPCIPGHSNASFSDGLMEKLEQVESLVRSLHTSWELSPATTQETKSTSVIIALPDCLDTLVFRNHLTYADKEWSEMKCHACDTTAYEYAKHEDHFQYCTACRRYSCEDCCYEEYDRNRNESVYHCNHCKIPMFDITGPRTYPT